MLTSFWIFLLRCVFKIRFGACFALWGCFRLFPKQASLASRNFLFACRRFRLHHDGGSRHELKLQHIFEIKGEMTINGEMDVCRSNDLRHKNLMKKINLISMKIWFRQRKVYVWIHRDIFPIRTFIILTKTTHSHLLGVLLLLLVVATKFVSLHVRSRQKCKICRHEFLKKA